MAKGHRIQINTRERAVSDDINDAQSLLYQTLHEYARAMAAESWQYWQNSTSNRVQADGTGAATPLRGDVYDGFELTIGTGSVLVGKGVLGVWTGTTGIGAHDSGYGLINDFGSGVLSIATNSGGTARCDVIECQPADTVFLTQSRDFYNTSTGQFTPAPAVKDVGPTLTYRVRQGTPGVPPGYAAGWLPLALAVVQPGATGDQIDYYDVRPLVRERGKLASTRSGGLVYPLEINPAWAIQCSRGWSGLGASTGTAARFTGQWSGAYLGHPLGGVLYKGTPVDPTNLSSFGTLDFNGVEFGPNNFLSSTSTVFEDRIEMPVLGLWIPNLGPDSLNPPLPRIQRYSQAAGSFGAKRVPWGPRGIPLIHSLSHDGMPDSTLITSRGIDGCLGYGFCTAIAATCMEYDARVVGQSAGAGDMVVWRTGHNASGGGPLIHSGVPMPRTVVLDVNGWYYHIVVPLHKPLGVTGPIMNMTKMRFAVQLQLLQYFGGSNLVAMRYEARVSTANDPNSTFLEGTTMIGSAHPSSGMLATYAKTIPGNYLQGSYHANFVLDVEPQRTSPAYLSEAYLHISVFTDSNAIQVLDTADTLVNLIGAKFY